MRSALFPRSSGGRSVACSLCAGGVFLLVAGVAHAVEITLASAWMRPVREGAPSAIAYVDITSDADMKLVGASSPAAKTVAIVAIIQNPDGTSTSKEVRELDIPAGHATRLAYNGTHLELREIRETLQAGQHVVVELEFIDNAGRRHVAQTGALIRGILLPQPPEPGPQSR
jgi:periplasmic copper chaperone A